MSVELFQSTINQLKPTTDRVIGVMDENGVTVACSDLSKMGSVNQAVRDELAYSGEITSRDGYTFKNIADSINGEYSVFVSGEDNEAVSLCGVLSVTFAGLKSLYDQKYNRAEFIRNVLLDNVLPGDMYKKIHDLKFSSDAQRIVLVVRVHNGAEINPYKTILNLFPDQNKDFIVAINENDVAIVKEIKDGTTVKDVEKIAYGVADTFRSEFYTNALIGIGSTAKTLREISRSYKEASLSIDVGRIFEIDKPVVCYENLGIARLLYQLPTTLCELYIKEIFGENGLDALDREMTETVDAFFENNLNVSEASRKLFVHRNTLVYRLDKLQRLTGLDIRVFDNAVTLKVAMMVNKYLKTKGL